MVEELDTSKVSPAGGAAAATSTAAPVGEKKPDMITSKVSPAGGAAAATSTAAPVGEKKPDMIEPVAATAATSTSSKHLPHVTTENPLHST